MPHLVRENLFIGNITDAVDVLQNGSATVTHILSVLGSASISFFSEYKKGLTIPTKEITKVYAGGGASASEDDGSGGKLLYLLEYAGKDLKLVRMGVPVRDMESENLLDYLEVCLDFIDKSRKEGSVLVHCFAGVSRSAAIITAYLMRTEQLSQDHCLVLSEIGQSFVASACTWYFLVLFLTYACMPVDALGSLRQSCEFVCPNDGFLNQLKMYEDMGFKVDHASPIYKSFRLKILGESYYRGDKIDSSKFGADPGLPSEVTSQVESSPIGGKNGTSAFRCKKCRRLVAVQDNVVDHIPGQGETSFEWRKQKSSNYNNSECSSIFVEPLKWMTAVEEGAMEGKLSCAHCEARLGYFNWSGIQCSCGSWITPAFQLHRSRVDMSSV
ncbi:putative phosphoric monoester hydrolase [Rosa chinensis]|uniref:protein-tyrosine-phosphatase n=1 Tax=Rosa chinensis TaxID=74649 RepID=A0A2P6SD04_ROSCH|nr:putative phosphoric monoester hydrolase [Rosa chinensis]